MKRTLIRYKTKPDMADKNAELIAGVFAELKATKPEGLRYLSLRLDDDTCLSHYRPGWDFTCAARGTITVIVRASGSGAHMMRPCISTFTSTRSETHNRLDGIFRSRGSR